MCTSVTKKVLHLVPTVECVCGGVFGEKGGGGWGDQLFHGAPDSGEDSSSPSLK